MSRRRKDPLRALTDDERASLEQLGRTTSAPAGVVARARALVAVADGYSYTEAARLTNVGIGDTGPVRIDSKGAHVKQSAHFEGQAFRIGGFEPATGRFR